MRILRVFTGGTSTQRGCPAGGPARPCRCFFKQHQALPARKFTSACQRRSKTMKKCKVCGENFEDKYAFCPLDGKPLLISLLPLGAGMRGNRPRRQALTPTLSQREREFDKEAAAFAPRHHGLGADRDRRQKAPDGP